MRSWRKVMRSWRKVMRSWRKAEHFFIFIVQGSANRRHRKLDSKPLALHHKGKRQISVPSGKPRNLLEVMWIVAGPFLRRGELCQDRHRVIAVDAVKHPRQVPDGPVWEFGGERLQHRLQGTLDVPHGIHVVNPRGGEAAAGGHVAGRLGDGVVGVQQHDELLEDVQIVQHGAQWGLLNVPGWVMKWKD